MICSKSTAAGSKPAARARGPENGRSGSATWIAPLVLGVLTAFWLPDPYAAQQPTPAKPESKDVVAVVEGSPITAAEIEELARERLLRLRSEEYRIRRQTLDEYIARKLLQKEAAERGITVDELTRREIHSKVGSVNGASIDKRSSSPEAVQALQRQQQQINDARKRYVNELKVKAAVRIFLEPPRVAIEAGDGPSLGPQTAPVTILEFSDFQCPYCGGVAPTLRRIEESYRGKVRVVFRHFPLSMHKHAFKAAEAAACAQMQGKFWEMHDTLFQNHKILEVSAMKEWAELLGIDAKSFGECLDSGSQARQWRDDTALGRRFGVTGTPTIFVNGRMLVGAQSYQTLVDIIEEELEAKGPRSARP